MNTANYIVCKLFTEKITLFGTTGYINQMYHFTSGSFLNIVVQMNKTIVITSLLLRFLYMGLKVVPCRMIQLFVTLLEIYRSDQTKGNTFKCFDRFYCYFAYYFRPFLTKTLSMLFHLQLKISLHKIPVLDLQVNDLQMSSV